MIPEVNHLRQSPIKKIFPRSIAQHHTDQRSVIVGNHTCIKSHSRKFRKLGSTLTSRMASPLYDSEKKKKKKIRTLFLLYTPYIPLLLLSKLPPLFPLPSSTSFSSNSPHSSLLHLTLPFPYFPSSGVTFPPLLSFPIISLNSPPSCYLLSFSLTSLFLHSEFPLLYLPPFSLLSHPSFLLHPVLMPP